MRKFLKTCHVISRILLYLCVIAVLLLYFFKPGLLELAQSVLPAADNGSWLAMVTALSIAAVMFAASEMAYRSLQDNEFMATLSSSVLKPAYDRYDLSDRRFKTASGELDFNASLRDVTDEKERVLRELAWERQHSKKLQKRTVGNRIVSLLFFVAGVVFFLFPFVWFFVTGKPLWAQTGTAMDYFSIIALILTMIIILEIGANQSQLRRLNTILSIRDRCAELDRKPAAALPQATAAPYVPTPAPAPVQVKPAPAPAEDPWKPEPDWSGVQEAAPDEKPESPFVQLNPEEESDGD